MGTCFDLITLTPKQNKKCGIYLIVCVNVSKFGLRTRISKLFDSHISFRIESKFVAGLNYKFIGCGCCCSCCSVYLFSSRQDFFLFCIFGIVICCFRQSTHGTGRFLKLMTQLISWLLFSIWFFFLFICFFFADLYTENLSCYFVLCVRCVLSDTCHKLHILFN